MATRSVVLPFSVAGTAPRGGAGASRLSFVQVLRAVITRRQLREMDDRMLADIGISRAEALREADRAPWDLSPNSALWFAGR